MAFELKEEGFRLKDVLKQVDIPEATYHYHINQMNNEDPNQEWKELISALFHKHEGRYGISKRPTLDFVLAPLDQAIKIIKLKTKLIAKSQ
ncbi:hypothetical protein [Paenisporosarcina antarctica]|uniref:HTH-like domain-containing protein n=1 Tax=Paenisporosarcina antarctica TaxID=417367 RepID=A0A4P6ZX13_9BACL|nr:hypothetical protein [Paenisporosarcina antarctica]QBP40971.1 hypothetical protein E2636_07445 [Paenisporosarcina antarctica]